MQKQRYRENASNLEEQKHVFTQREERLEKNLPCWSQARTPPGKEFQCGGTVFVWHSGVTHPSDKLFMHKTCFSENDPARIGPGTCPAGATPGLCRSSGCTKKDSELRFFCSLLQNCAHISFLSIFSPLEQSCYHWTELKPKCRHHHGRLWLQQSKNRVLTSSGLRKVPSDSPRRSQRCLHEEKDSRCIGSLPYNVIMGLI